MKVGLIFPGYGDQFVGMGKDIYDQSRIMQEYFEEASHCLDTNFVKLCFASSDASLSKAVNAYPALFLINSALWAVIKQKGIQPDKVAGFGLGELSAIHAADGITFPDGLYLLKKYALAHAEASDTVETVMANIAGIDEKRLKAFCKSYKDGNDLAISLYINHEEFVIVGTKEGIEFIKQLCKEYKDISFKILKGDYGRHSFFMESALQERKMYLEKVDFKDLKMPLITAVDGVQVLHGEAVKYSLIRQVTEPIVINQVFDNFIDCEILIVPGPGTRVISWLEKKYPEKTILKVTDAQDLANLEERLQSSST